LLIQTLFGVDDAKIEVASGLLRGALNLLLIRLGRFAQLSPDIELVVRGQRELFPLAGMIAQLESLGEVLTGPPRLGETEVFPAHCQVAHGKIRIELDGALVVRQSSAGAFFA